jgi:hypothetical protein
MPGSNDLTGCALADPFRVSVTPYVVRKYTFVPDVDIVTYCLSHQMGGYGEQLQPVFVKKLFAICAISIIGFVDFHVIAPAGQFQSVVSESAGFPAYGFQVKIGPLAGK